MKEQHDAIDVLKFIGSVMIFAMHARAFADVARVRFAWELLSRWAVPLFFVTSSYFLFSHGDGVINAAQLKKYERRIAMLYLVWFVFNLPGVVYTKMTEMSSFALWEIAVLVKDTVLSSTYIGSWYLVSSMFCAWLVYILRKRLSARMILIIAAVVQVVCVLSSVYAGLLPQGVRTALEFWDFPWNVLDGFFYFALGLFFAEKKEWKQKFSVSRCVALAAGGFALYAVEIIVSVRLGYYNVSDQAFGLAPLCIGLFAFGMCVPLRVKYAGVLRKMSTIIYCAQGNVIVLKRVAARMFPALPSLLLFAVCAAVMTGIIAAVFALQKKSTRWAKYLT